MNKAIPAQIAITGQQAFISLSHFSRSSKLSAEVTEIVLTLTFGRHTFPISELNDITSSCVIGHNRSIEIE